MQNGKKPLVTICVPTVGRTEFLPATIEAIREQTLGEYEVLVLDNASPEAAQKQLAEWAASDHRVHVLRADPRVPMFPNFNRGIRAARGKYVTFFHDDDVYREDFLEKIVGMLERHPRTGFGGCNFDSIDERGEVFDRRRWIERTEVWPGQRYIRDIMARARSPMPMSALVFRREVLGDGFDEQMSIYYGDYVILMRYAEEWDVAVVAEPCMQLRKHARQESQTAMPMSDAIALRAQILQSYADEYRKRRPHDARFANYLASRVRATKRIGLVWAWFAANDETDARGSLRQLRDGDRALAGALRVLEKAGLTLERRKGTVLDMARRLGNSVGL